MKNNDKHGLFISYKRSNKFLAGRIYDYFYYRGLNPFMDEHTMNQTDDFEKYILTEIDKAPYFLCLVTKDGYEELKSKEVTDKMVYFHEVERALKNENVQIRLVLYPNDFDIKSEELNPSIANLAKANYYKMTDSNLSFISTMEHLYEKDIDTRQLISYLDWKEYEYFNGQTVVDARGELENLDFGLFSLKHRFGKEFVESIKDKVDFDASKHHIKEINMVCYAGSIIFAPHRHMVDHKAYDYGLMFNIFSRLFEKSDFHLDMIINAPFSDAAKSAVKYNMLGNDALKDDQQAVFYGSYGSLCDLIQDGPFKEAYKNHQFSFMVTERPLPYALFEIIYDEEYKEYNHIKVDLYSYGIDANSERRTMVFFQTSDASNYNFFKKQITMLKDEYQLSKALIKKNHKFWMSKWEKFKKENDRKWLKFILAKK